MLWSQRHDASGWKTEIIGALTNGQTSYYIFDPEGNPRTWSGSIGRKGDENTRWYFRTNWSQTRIEKEMRKDIRSIIKRAGSLKGRSLRPGDVLEF